MSRRRSSFRLVAVVGVLLLVACSSLPISLFSRDALTATPAPSLSRCDESPGDLCVLTFDFRPPSNMQIVLLGSSALPSGLSATIEFKGSILDYTCRIRRKTPTLAYCTGAQLPLSSSFRIDVYDSETRNIVASGDFVLDALAVPTVPLEGVGLPTPIATSTARPTRTPLGGADIPDLIPTEGKPDAVPTDSADQ